MDPIAELEYASLFRAEYASIVRASELIVHDRELARDIAQEAFSRLALHWTKIAQYERPGAWVRRVAIRLSVKAARREGRRTAVQSSFSGNAARGADADAELPMELLTHLSPQQRAAIVLFYVEDRPICEIAETLGCKEATARVHLHRGREGLRKAFAIRDHGAKHDVG